MSGLLLELFSEEIPSRMQQNAAGSLLSLVSSGLEERKIKFSSISSFVTPRRLTVVVDNIKKTISSSQEERRGPRVGAKEQAIEGFLKSCSIDRSKLKIKKTPKGEFYFAVLKKDDDTLNDALTKVIENAIISLSWPKSMRWGRHDIKWVRPLHSILCIFDSEVLPVVFGHLKASNVTRGHRFMADRQITVSSFADYKKKLSSAHVLLDFVERKNIIKQEAEKIASVPGLRLREDEDLLNEVAGLVELPVVLKGKINEKFMYLPDEVLISSMRMHQKYLSLLDGTGKLAPYFIMVANIRTQDDCKHIINGNEKVLNARLEDARFFYEQDRRDGLESRIPLLKNVVFHAALGTVFNKVERIAELAKLICIWVPHANMLQVERAARLCKADLVSKMVGEFAELQGIMGSYYAYESKEDKEVAVAIREHYSPMGPSDTCPLSPVSVTVAMADKVDSIVGLFMIDERPTGSRDPYALRRAALGVIRIILENNLRMPLRLLFNKAFSKYPKSIFKSVLKQKNTARAKEGKKKQSEKQLYEKTISNLLDFFVGRLKIILEDEGVSKDIIHAVFDGGSEDDMVRLRNRAIALRDFLATQDGQDLLAAYKRATNIVINEEQKDGVKYDGTVKKDLLEKNEEITLFDCVQEMTPKITDALQNEDFKTVMEYIASLKKPVDEFFDNVIVNCDDKNIRKNRLYLLATLRKFLNQVANFSNIG